MNQRENFRGIRKVYMVSVLEGNGEDTPFREVHYVFDLDQHGGSHGGLVGKIDVIDTLVGREDNGKCPSSKTLTLKNKESCPHLPNF